MIVLNAITKSIIYTCSTRNTALQLDIFNKRKPHVDENNVAS